MKQKLLAAISSLVVMTGCASSTTQYYEAVEAAAQANAAASQAKFDALSAIAAAGDGQAASAAVMALALTQTPTVTPVPQQSQALQWASILAAPISNLGMMWLQTDSTKAMAEYNKDVSLARISADSVNQQAMFSAFTAGNALTADVAVAGFDAVGNVDYTPFINGMVDLGTAGITGAVDLGTAGFAANTDIATVGLNTAGQLGVTGMNNLTALGATGMANLVDLGTAGLGATVATADLGINGTVALGTTGMTSLTNLGTTGMTNLTELGTAGMTDLTTLGTTGMTDLRGLAQYTTLYDYLSNADWLTYATSKDQTIEDMFGSIGCTITTTTDGALVVTCN
jgi:hypothetical protein